MSRRALPLLVLLAGLAAAAGCGKKGPIQAPLVRAPQAVQGFRAFQRGDAFRLEWKLAAAYIDGTPFTKPVEVEIWLVEEELPAGPAAAVQEPAAKTPDEAKPDAAAPAEKSETEGKAAEAKPTEAELPPATAPAALEKAPKPEPAAEQEAAPQAPAAVAPASPQAPAAAAPSLFAAGEMPLEVFMEKAVLAGGVPAVFGETRPEAQAADLVAQSFERPVDPARLRVSATFAVRVKDHRKKYSEYSSRITVVPRVLPGPPRNVRLTLHEDKVALTWEAPAPGPDQAAEPAPAGYNVYRARATDPPQLQTEGGPVMETGYEDKAFAFGETYRYTVRTVVGESAPYLESVDSEAVEASPRDTFPPAPPSGLKTVSGPGFISLIWEKGPEPDLDGYRVWRRLAAAGEFTLLTEAAIRETSFVDRSVESGRRYAYAVSALDKSGNESRRTKPANETARSPEP